MPWIEFHQSLPTHRKLLRLTGALGIRVPAALGHLALLWLWALDNAPDGSLRGVSEKELARVCQFPARRAADFAAALAAAGFVDETADGARIHDWEDYGGKYQRKREMGKKRLQEYRKRVRNACVTQPENRTEEESTEEESTGEDRTEEKASSAAVDEALCAARGGLEDYWKRRRLHPDSFAKAGGELEAQTRALAGELLPRLGGRAANEADRLRVHACCTVYGEDLRPRFDPDRRDLLLYAFEQAAKAGCAGDWRYVDGVLDRLDGRGLRTLAEVQRYDFQRRGEKLLAEDE